MWSVIQPIRLAVIFDQELGAGGGYQQALNAISLVGTQDKNLVLPVYFTTHQENVSVLKGIGIDAQVIPKPTFFRNKFATFRRLITHRRMLFAARRIMKHSPFERLMLSQKIDLVYFISPSYFAHDLEELNYITTVWDISHREDPEFPEVRLHREFERRDYHYRRLLPRATGVLVDSPRGQELAVRNYGLNPERVHIMPFESAMGTRVDKLQESAVSIRKMYGITNPYIFYPAQFWAHKNHVYVLEGLKALESQFNLKIDAVFSGNNYGTRSYIEAYASKLKIADRVHFLGFVPNEHMSQLYKQSIALVMPTYFGPTNLPPLEAFELGVPLLYSDKFGIKDQVEGAALLMDLTNPSSMANQLAKLINDPALRKKLIRSGKNRLKELNTIDRGEVLARIFRDFHARKMTWGGTNSI